MSYRERGQVRQNSPRELLRNICPGAKIHPLCSRWSGLSSKTEMDRTFQPDLPGRHQGADPGDGYHDSIHRQRVSKTFQHFIFLHLFFGCRFFLVVVSDHGHRGTGSSRVFSVASRKTTGAERRLPAATGTGPRPGA